MERIKWLALLPLLAILVVLMAGGTPRSSAAPARAAAPNDQGQARLRVSQCVFGAPDMDVYLNGTVPVVAGVPLAKQAALNATRYEYLAPGAYSLALAPNGGDPSKPFLGPLDVPVVAGHRYTVVALGQKDDAAHQALVIDETAAYQAVGLKPAGVGHITVNNVKGAPGIDFYEGGVVLDAGVPYGGFKAAVWPIGPFKGLKVTVGGAPDQPLDPGFDGDGYNAPGFDFFDCFGGRYPGTIGQDFDTHTSSSTSTLNTVELLQTLSAEATKDGRQPDSNSRFLAALQTAGLTEMLAHGGPYIVFAPSDAAFAAVPKDTLAAWMANPQVLAGVLRRHIIAGYYPPGTITTSGLPGFNRTIPNLLDEPLAIKSSDAGLLINGVKVGSADTVMTANGTRVFPWLDTVLLPPGGPPAAPTAAPPPGTPSTGGGTTPAVLIGLGAAVVLLLLAGGLLRRAVAAR